LDEICSGLQDIELVLAQVVPAALSASMANSESSTEPEEGISHSEVIIVGIGEGAARRSAESLEGIRSALEGAGLSAFEMAFLKQGWDDPAKFAFMTDQHLVDLGFRSGDLVKFCRAFGAPASSSAQDESLRAGSPHTAAASTTAETTLCTPGAEPVAPHQRGQTAAARLRQKLRERKSAREHGDVQAPAEGPETGAADCEDLCVVCLCTPSESGRPVQWVFQGCGHKCVCKPCLRKLKEKQGKSSKNNKEIECPICRARSRPVLIERYDGQVFATCNNG